ncbi:MAG: DNA repair protein RecN [Lachnospiraceae bacterium]|nr:DNA repair protein RecN [Lachnospiraceae bacterium]MDY5742123.1 DNA repair protein RecN [Lachnospiraceae bacterium]
MLQSLRVDNLALIDHVELELGPGLTVFSGETGAGKSMLIGGIAMILGQKVSKENIGDRADSVYAEGVFTVDATVRAQLEELDIAVEEDEVILSRRLYANRSVARINGETVPLSRLREVGQLLASIHGQHDTRFLLQSSGHMQFVDWFGGAPLQEVKEEVDKLYRQSRQLHKEWAALQMDEQEYRKQVDFLEFELNQIEEAGLQPGEDERLEEAFKRLDHQAELMTAAGQAADILGNDGGVRDTIGAAISVLKRGTALSPQLAAIHGQLLEIDSLLADSIVELSDFCEQSEVDEAELAALRERLDLINYLKSKYGRHLEDILAYADETAIRLERLRQVDELRRDLEEQMEQNRRQLETAAGRLSVIRREAAKGLTGRLLQVLEELHFAHVEVDFIFSVREQPTAAGYDDGEFVISTNPGQPPRSMANIASGGELSRIMLALQTLLSDRLGQETLLFDEIDSGISGITAMRVGEKLQQLATNSQILVITHLAAVAARADRHFLISKQVADGMTRTLVEQLSEQQEVTELARLLGGDHLSEAVLTSAAELKAAARRSVWNAGSLYE